MRGWLLFSEPLRAFDIFRYMIYSTNQHIVQSGGTLTVDVTYSDCTSSTQICVVTGSYPWVTVSAVSGTQETSTTYKMTYNISVSPTTVKRYAVFQLGYSTTQGATENKPLFIAQYALETVYAPIWKDCTYYALGEPEKDFCIKYGDDAIFFGRSYSAPDENGSEINLNRVCMSYLDNVIQFSAGVMSNGAYGVFSLCDGDDNVMMVYHALCAYDGDWDGGDQTMSDPVNGHLDARMLIPTTIYNEETQNIEYEITNI